MLSVDLLPGANLPATVAASPLDEQATTEMERSCSCSGDVGP